MEKHVTVVLVRSDRDELLDSFAQLMPRIRTTRNDVKGQKMTVYKDELSQKRRKDYIFTA